MMLEILHLRVQIESKAQSLFPVDDLSILLAPGRTLALVGESGCGKTMTALAVMRLLPQGASVAGGGIFFDGRDITRLAEDEMRRLRGRHIAMIFQEPVPALNPSFSVGSQIAEMFTVHEGLSRRQARRSAVEALREVGIADPGRRYREYPHQMSGGMAQRVMIAMALAAKPRLLLADEPTTALDVTIQAQVVSLLKAMQERHGMAVLFITHDLALAREVADDIAVMYAGTLMERGPAVAVVSNPVHPYAKALLASRPSRAARPGETLPTIPGTVANPASYPAGCRFHPRCPEAEVRCRQIRPEMEEVQNGHFVRCWLLAREQRLEN